MPNSFGVSPSTFKDDSAVAVRALEVPAADFDNGCNLGGSNAHGIGINYSAGTIPVVGTPEQFTLVDQDGDVRDPQVSQVLGGEGVTEAADWPGSGGLPGKGVDSIRAGDPSDSGDGTVAILNNCDLIDIAIGWQTGL